MAGAREFPWSFPPAGILENAFLEISSVSSCQGNYEEVGVSEFGEGCVRMTWGCGFKM